MAITTGSKVQYEYMLGGGVPPLVTLGVSSGQTYLPGAFLKLDSSGHIVAATSGTLATATHFALTSGDNSTADGITTQTVLLITNNVVFSAVCYHATTASAVPQSTQIGDRWPLISATDTADAVWVLSIATSGAGGWVIANKDTTGTAYGRNYFVISGITENDSPWCCT